MTQNDIDTVRWLVEKHGSVVHKGAFAAICQWIEERRKTVRAKRPVQYSKVKILLCGQPKKICVDYHHGRCNDPQPCSWQRKPSTVA